MDKGAHFHKCDLQVHSPRDLRWSGSKCKSEEERKAYAESLVAHCRSIGLNAIAITDHHDMAFIPYVRKAAEEETDEHGELWSEHRQLKVFPGMELTLSVPCQAIIILDANFPENLFASVMTALTITPAPDENESTNEVERLTFNSLKQMCAELDRHKSIKGRYIILPNVTNDGKFSLLRTGSTEKYKEMPCVGGYIDGSVDRVKVGFRTIVDGRDRAWGNKKIALFQTSDNRREDHSVLGKFPTWVKWAEPSAEALRQACLADQSRVSHLEPVFPETIITAISVSNSKFLGRVDLEFNRQYNSIIGGRGTGKSTILEYLRWALCDVSPTISSVNVPNYALRRERLIEKTLKPLASTVDVTLFINGVTHVVRRYSDDGRVKIKIDDEEFRECSELEIKSLLPIQAYSQKQLSEVSVRIDELSSFIKKPILNELNKIDRDVSDIKEKLKRTYSSKLRFSQLGKRVSKLKFELKSVEQQVQSLRAALPGVSESDAALFEKSKSYDSANRKVSNFIRDLEYTLDKFDSLQSELEGRKNNSLPNVEDDDLVVGTANAYEQIVNSIIESLKKHIQDITRAVDSHKNWETVESETEWSKWQKSFVEVKKAYQSVIDRSSVRQERMEALEVLERRSVSLQSEIDSLKSEIGTLKTEADRYLNNRQAWLDLISERNKLIQLQCSKLYSDSDKTIRANIDPTSNLTSFSEKLKELISGSGVRKDKVDRLCKNVLEADIPTDAWLNLIEDLESLSNFDTTHTDAVQLPETPLFSAAGFNQNEKFKVAEKITDGKMPELSLIYFGSNPVFEFCARDGEYIPFSDASAGQQSTALLRTLLNQSGAPLIIDQPEEDLDNPVVQDIVELIWKSKQNRQIIFVSHNANLVVNGDAELVVWCEHRIAGDQTGGKIGGEGAIDMFEVREAIKNIMEGGQAAFELRKMKYGF